MDEVTWKNLVKEIRKVKDDYPLVNEEVHSEVEREHQDEAWAETYRKEFQKEMLEQFEGAFDRLQWGDRIKDKFEAMLANDEATDQFFYEYMSRHSSGGEWTEHDDGDMSLRVDKIVMGIDVQDIINELWPEDPRQMHLKFESLARQIVDRLLEAEEPHDYSCVMINLPEELGERIMQWGRSQIKSEEINVDAEGGKGWETEPHITVKYGLTAAKPDDRLMEVFRNTAPFEVTLGPCSLFRNGEYDVVKLDVTSPYLMALNRQVNAVADAPGDRRPEYRPHVTIAYVRPNSCERLEGHSPFEDPVKFGVTSIGKEGKFTAEEVIFSSIDGTKSEIPLGHAVLTAKPVKETEEEDVAAFLKHAIPAEQEMAPSGLRKLVRRSVVDRVEVTGNRLGPGQFEIYYYHGPELRVVRHPWGSVGCLAQALRQWRNLEGADLIVNGKPAGKISYRNPVLAELAR